MEKIIRVYRLINILSLDVAAGAMVSASFFAHLFGTTVLPQGFISLGITVWIIYTADHLQDAKKLNHDASTERHRFHQQNYNLLLLLLFIAVLVDAAQIYFIRTIVFYAGLWLSLLVGIYFLVQRRLGFLKELFGTLLYTGGVLLIPFSMRTHVAVPVIFIVGQFAVTALINLLLFSWIDRSRDERDKHQSFATAFGSKTTRLILISLFVGNAILTVLQFVFSPDMAFATSILVLMNSILLLIFVKKDYFEKEDRYRLLGDAIFMLPLLYILFSSL